MKESNSRVFQGHFHLKSHQRHVPGVIHGKVLWDVNPFHWRADRFAWDIAKSTWGSGHHQ